MRLYINDTAFAHCTHSVAGQFTKDVEWIRGIGASCGTTDPYFHFYTNEQCYGPLQPSYLPIKNVAWLIESRGIIPHIYDNFYKVGDRFDIILTHSSEILKDYPDTAKWIFGGGSYIGTTHGGGEEKIYPKSKFCSMVSSNKTMCPLHVFRAKIADYFSKMPEHKVAVFGTILEPSNWSPIINSLADYRYSIVVENYVDDAFWTEKLTNCFLTGTVPIYYGARKIGDYFNKIGIPTFDDFDELVDFLDSINSDDGESDYNFRLNAIRENFEEAKKYRLMEDWIVERIINA